MLDTLWGDGQDLTVAQMALRAFAMFFVALALVRIAGMRAFGRKSSFDTIVAVLLGAILSRAIYGASPTLPIIAACAALVMVHRLIALLTARYPGFEQLVKGPKIVLFRDGVELTSLAHRHGISRTDLLEGDATPKSIARSWPRSRRSGSRAAAS